MCYFDFRVGRLKNKLVILKDIMEVYENLNINCMLDNNIGLGLNILVYLCIFKIMFRV